MYMIPIDSQIHSFVHFFKVFLNNCTFDMISSTFQELWLVHIGRHRKDMRCNLEWITSDIFSSQIYYWTKSNRAHRVVLSTSHPVPITVSADISCISWFFLILQKVLMKMKVKLQIILPFGSALTKLVSIPSNFWR